jgi:SAM-dependent methyltransferase
MSQTETLEEVKRAGAKRLYPSVCDPNWLVLKRRRGLFQNWIHQRIRTPGSVLDVGGRLQPYRALLPELTPYFSVDLVRTPLVNVVADAAQLPFSATSFSMVVCTQMLEYAREPSKVIAEIYRVLEPGGWLLLSVPAVFPRDSDDDRWRFLPAGIRHLLSSFEEVEIVAEGSSIAGLFRTLNVYLTLFATYPGLRGPVKYALVPALNLLGDLAERFIRSSNDQFAANYSVLAKKGPGAPDRRNDLVPAV